MKKVISQTLIAAVLLFGFSTSGISQKIGYISADEIIQMMPEADSVQKTLNDYQQSLYQIANDKKNSLNQSIQEFYKDSATMSPSLKEVKRTELQQEIQELSGEDQKIQTQFEQKRQELSLPIQKKLQSAIEAVAKENGYTYIFPKEALIYMPPSSDIGPLVVKKLGLKAKAARAVPPPSN